MGSLGTLARTVWRAFNTDGVPASGAHNPVKSEIIAWSDLADSLIASLGGVLTYATKTALDADLAHAAGTQAVVYADGTSANNALYVKSGGSGSGSWVKVFTLSAFASLSGVILADGSNAFTADQSLGNHKLTNVADPTIAQHAATKAYVDALSALVLHADGTVAASADIPFGGHKITGLADPTSAQHGATKAYVDTALAALALLETGLDAGFAWTLRDALDRVAFGLRHDGRTYVAGFDFDWGAEVVSSDLWLFNETYGRLNMTGGRHTYIRAPQVSSKELRYFGSADNVTFERVRKVLDPQPAFDSFVTGLQGIPFLSDSVALGTNNSEDGTVLTSAPLDVGRALMPNIGVRTLGTFHVQGPGGSIPLPDVNIANLVDLYEQSQPAFGETPASHMAHRLLASTPSTIAVALSHHGIAGINIGDILKTSSPNYPYMNLIRQVVMENFIARRTGRTYKVRGVPVVCGSNNGTGTEQEIVDWLVALQTSLDTDIKAVTGQSETVVCVLVQSSVMPSPFPSTAMLRAYLENTTKFMVVCPSYFFDYLDETPSPWKHLTRQSSAWMGEYLGRAYAQQFISASPWKPVYATAAVRTAANVALTFYMPTSPLVFDTTLVNDPTGGHKGIRFYDGAGTAQTASVAISSVTLTNAATGLVTVALSGVPSGPNPRLEIGTFSDATVVSAPYTGGGPTKSPRACIRDSSADAWTIDGVSMPGYNWAAHQIIAIT